MWSPFNAKKPWAQYVSAFRDSLNVWAVWWPGDHVEVGDFGVLEKGCFRRRGTLKTHLRIGGKDIRDKVIGTKLQIGGFRSSQFATGIRAEANPIGASARAELEVGSSQGVFFRATGLSKSQLLSPPALERRLLETVRDEAFEWSPDYFLVHEVVSAESFVALTTRSGNTSIQVRGSADALESLSVGVANAAAGIEVSTGVDLQILGQSGAIALGLMQVDTSRMIQADQFAAGEDPEVRLRVILPQSIQSAEFET